MPRGERETAMDGGFGQRRRPARSARRSGAALRRAAIAGLAAAGPALAAPASAPVCAPAPGDPLVTLKTVSDDGDVLLADGRALRLAGLDLARATPASPDLPASARAALLAWAPGSVVLHPLSGPDRWGRIPALLFRPGAPGSAGAALVGAGVARVAPEPAARACTPDLLAAEVAARAAGRGLWADPRYAVLGPGDAEGLEAQAGGMALVQGILHLHPSRGALYLALGRDRRGFVAVVSRRDAKAFVRAGLDLQDYVGTPVRLRGDLDARFGPRMRLADPDAVESLEPGSIAEEGSRP